MTKLSYKLAIPLVVLALMLAVFGLPHKASAQYYDDSGFDWGGYGYSDPGYGGYTDNSGYNWGGYGYNDGYSGYSDPCSYGCGYDSGYYGGYDCCGYSDYGYGGYDCCSYGGGYGGYDCCSYSGGYSSMPSINLNYQSQNQNQHQNQSQSTSVNVTNHNTNTNNNNVVVNVPNGGTNNNPPPTYSNLSAYCVGSPSNPGIDDDVTWQAYASGGNGNYNYSWSGDTSGSSRTEIENYGSSGTKNATVQVRSGDGQSVTASCSVRVQPRGSTVSNVSVYQQPYYPQPLGTPSAGVYLSQIPATGISPTMKLALFVLGLALWSAFGAYMVLEKRKMSTLALAGTVSSFENVGSDSVKVIENPVANVGDNLSVLAREKNVLISRDGVEAIVARANGNQAEAENILSTLIGKVSRNEGDYATLNAEKINKLI
jgi:hypothetical protein